MKWCTMECLNKVFANVQNHQPTQGLFCSSFYNNERNAMTVLVRY